ncbi:MAG: M23 family metallopeptidase [Heteroscytonema crispum UTEX LB 1556]
MKKVIVSRFCTYGLIAIISLTDVLSTNTSALTQQTGISTSNLIWPAQGILSQGFSKTHEGIDIASASGTPIIAAASGTVTKAGWDDWGLGNEIEIKHPNGSVTVYGHNRRLLVSKGQQVNQGQVIAEMGSTGNSTAPHLHFEVHPNGRVAVNPLDFLPSSTASKVTPQQKAANNQNRRVLSSAIATQISPSQPIPVAFAPMSINAECRGVTLIEGETANVRVKVCQENGQLFYIGQLKQDPNQLVKLPAFNVGNSRYRADNGSFSYFVSPDGVEVLRNGRPFHSDSFYTSKVFGG